MLTFVQTKQRMATASALLGLLFLVLGSDPVQATRGEPMQSLKVSSAAFEQGRPIPTSYSCEGQSISPPLSWSGLPQGTRSVALIVDDPDAPRGTWVHWVVYNLPPETLSLSEEATLPSGTQVGKNSANETKYYPMCPPSGRHRYFFKVYALDSRLDGLRHPSAAELEKAMEGHVLASGELMGTYEKGHR